MQPLTYKCVEKNLKEIREQLYSHSDEYLNYYSYTYIYIYSYITI